MVRLFVELPSFRADWTDLGLTDADLSRLQQELLVNPAAGNVLQGTGGVRKMRFAFPDRGKSGSVRVVYVDFVVKAKLYLLAVYAKNEKDNLSKAERNQLKKLVEYLGQELDRKEGSV